MVHRGTAWIGEWLVEPTLACVSKGGKRQCVTPRAMAVLVRLDQSDGSVVSRNDLLDAVWPGMAVTPDALSQCLVELRRVFGESPKQPEVIETIPKMGIRLIPPVVEQLARSRTRLASDASKPRSRPDGDRRSLAVLPFDSLSSDPENAYFAAGMQEEILTRLARLPSRFRVISRTSVLRYAKERPPLHAIAQELGADIILEGSVTRMLSDRRFGTAIGTTFSPCNRPCRSTSRGRCASSCLPPKRRASIADSRAQRVPTSSTHKQSIFTRASRRMRRSRDG